MSSHKTLTLAAALAVSLASSTFVSSTFAYEFGRPATPEEIKLWDIDVMPDGKGLPEGSGTVAHGKQVYQDNCEACHGTNGEGGIKDRVFDYISRAMPYPIPGSLGADDTYAVTAYILSLNGIVPADGKVDKDSLPKIKMPNRDGFIPDAVFKIDNEPEAPAKRGVAR
jgi:S-disulfanyl-L-cysteine oxidoreductase SoxD